MDNSVTNSWSYERSNEEIDPKNCRYSNKKPSLWDRMFYGHLTNVIFLGFRKTIEAKDLYPLHTKFKAKDTSQKILSLWKRHYGKSERGNISSDDDEEILIRPDPSKKKINMLGLVFRAFWPHFLSSWFFTLMLIALNLIPPYLIGKIDEFLDDEKSDKYTGYYIGGALLVSQQIASVFTAQSYGTLYNIGIKCQSGFTSAILQKALKLSPKSSKEYSTGDIVNLVSVDLDNLMWFITMSNTTWQAPISIVLTFFLIYQYLGVYCLAGAVAIVVFAPFLVLMTKLESSLQLKQMSKKDERVEMVTEVFNNVKVIKLYAWEDCFKEKIQKLRQQETRLMNLYLVACNMFGFAWNCFPFLVSTSALAAFMFLDKHSYLDPKTVLVSIAYFNAMRFELTNFPFAISLVAKTWVSMNRIRTFLEAEEVDPNVCKEDLEDSEEISLKNATFSWGDDQSPVLHNIDLSIKKGELVAVVGSVASGKSSLIQAILGEMTPVSGSINRRLSRRVAYVPQQAWILNTTIRNNVLFGKSFNYHSYGTIMRKCCLAPDLKILPAGDATEIGEKGVNLSGGQKQRVSVARAVYQDADVYLLDDPLSAVDAHVSYDLFKDIIGPEGLLQHKTRLLVTHSVAVLPQVDRIIVMEDGRITHQGTYDEIMKDNAKLKELIQTHSKAQEDSPTPEPEKMSNASTMRKRTASCASTASAGSAHLERQLSELPSGRLIDEEEMEVGKVRWRVYFEFLWKFGVIGSFLTLAGFTMNRVADSASLYYLTKYSNDIKEHNGTTTEDMWAHLQIYLAIGGVQAVSVLIGLTALALGCIFTSTKLHNQMLDAVLKAPMSFFDSTPTGRILNRFSRDVEDLDGNLYSVFDGYLDTVLSLVVVLVLISVKLPTFLAILVPLMLLFFGIQQFYMSSSRQIKRLSAITKSPVLNSFNENINGAVSLRAYAAQGNFIQKNMRFLDNNQNCMYHEYNGYRWLAIRLNIIGGLIQFGVCCLLTYFRSEIPAWLGTLMFSFAIDASTGLTWVVRLGAQVENCLVAAERVLDYTKTKSEAPYRLKGDETLNWPTAGNLKFRNYSTRYKENLDLVLKNINLDVQSEEKVGIVGRTGAGKSSLTLALLRVVEAVQGNIVIDNVDISKLGLHALRSRIAMIPQDPVLFKGTLRDNIDPENKYSDEQVWESVEKAHLKNSGKSLDFKVDEGGANLSVGERQLVCLSRALLRNSKVLILDEATAAVDLETDALIQKTIRQDFRKSTVITIAHRLHTIMDYDKIVVLDHGEIKEVGAPKDLLANPDGIFTSMAKDANLKTEE